MATVIKIKIQVDEIANVLTQFDQLKVYRSTTGINGIYTEITTASTRIALQQGVETYCYDDLAGSVLYYYKTSYFNSVNSLESEQSCPQLGDDPATCGILSVEELKQVYLFGLDLTNDAGEPFPDIMFDWAIRWAIANVERQLDILIKPTPFIEQRYDYYYNDYVNWTIIDLRESPVISVDKVAVKWPSDTVVIEFPQEWIQLRKESGQVNIVPTSGTLQQVLLTAGGSFLPLLATGQDFVPNILAVDYTAGFEDGQVPMDIRDVVGKYSSLPILNVAGDLIVGAGIASSSLSIDGLSQSINSTSSATNAGFGARILQYQRELKEQIPLLRRYYKGLKLSVLG